MFKYAGIGSRKTPEHMLNAMSQIGEWLSPRWGLRTGFADGADKAFAYGCETASGLMLNYLPWRGYNGAPVDDERFITLPATGACVDLTAAFHPAWDKCSDAAKLLHIRNTYIVFGSDLMKPVDMVVCWTADGKDSGGTGQAIRLASYRSIPVFNLYFESHQDALLDFVGRLEESISHESFEILGDPQQLR